MSENYAYFWLIDFILLPCVPLFLFIVGINRFESVIFHMDLTVRKGLLLALKLIQGSAECRILLEQINNVVEVRQFYRQYQYDIERALEKDQ